MLCAEMRRMHAESAMLCLAPGVFLYVGALERTKLDVCNFLLSALCCCSCLQFVDKYLAAAAGPAKWTKLVEFLKTTYPRITADLVNRQQNQVCCRFLGACMPHAGAACSRTCR